MDGLGDPPVVTGNLPPLFPYSHHFGDDPASEKLRMYSVLRRLSENKQQRKYAGVEWSKAGRVPSSAKFTRSSGIENRGTNNKIGKAVVKVISKDFKKKRSGKRKTQGETGLEPRLFQAKRNILKQIKKGICRLMAEEVEKDVGIDLARMLCSELDVALSRELSPIERDLKRLEQRAQILRTQMLHFRNELQSSKGDQKKC